MHTVHARRAVTRCTLFTLLSNVLLALAQFAAGIFGASQALVADALHTLSDVVADLAVLATAVFTAQSSPATRVRVESAVHKFIGALLLGTALALLIRTVDGLSDPVVPPVPHPLAIACAGLVMLTKEWMCRYALLVARRVDAPLLVASAWHHRSDALSSALVLFALVGAQFGLAWLDLAAALVVAAMIAVAGGRLILTASALRPASARAGLRRHEAG